MDQPRIVPVKSQTILWLLTLLLKIHYIGFFSFLDYLHEVAVCYDSIGSVLIPGSCCMSHHFVWVARL